MREKPIYLDGLSSTPLAREVAEAMRPFFTEHYGNPSSAHRYGLFLKKAMHHAREQAARLIGALETESILFTSSGTEAANLAVQGAARAQAQTGKGRHLIIGEVEHPSVKRSAQHLVREGFEITELSVDHEGSYSAKALEAALRPDTILVALQHLNYDLGTIQPVRELARVAREHGALFFCDGAMSVGWLALDVEEWKVDLLSFTPHRFSGPTGVGALYVKGAVELEPLFYGGAQERGLRPGTENIPAIVGAGQACELRRQQREVIAKKTAHLQELLFQRLIEKLPHMRLNGPPLGLKRAPHHLSLSFEGIEAEALVLRLDLQGICVHGSTGCLVKSLKVPYTLKALGLSDELALSTILIGLGEDLSEEDIFEAAQAIIQSVEKLRAMSIRWKRIQSGELQAQTRERL